MQHIHSIDTDAGGRRFFAGDGDRRLCPHHHNQLDLKCPRCESVNTKFCYYNNYNLSQPRHFCKSCRRYWTKGGILRNVPVGGGIRKAKRSKAKSKNDVAVAAAAAADVPRERKSSNSENSSSDSSSLTAANTTARIIPNSAAPVVSGSNSINSTPTLLNFNQSSTRFFGIPHSSAPITTFDPLISNQSSTGNMPPEIGMFTSLMNSSTDQLGFNVAGDISSFTLHQHNPNQLQWMHTDVKMPDMASAGFMDHDQTADIEFGGLGSRRSNGGLAGTDYDQGLFDLTGTVDQSYWGQSQWNVHDHGHHLNYLP